VNREPLTIPASIQIPPFELTDDRLSELRLLAERLETAAARLENALSEQTVSWSEEEVSKMHDISEATLKRMRANRQISFAVIGRKPRYTRQHLEEYFERNTVRARGKKKP
jgi:hypothetical protein